MINLQFINLVKEIMKIFFPIRVRVNNHEFVVDADNYNNNYLFDRVGHILGFLIGFMII